MNPQRTADAVIPIRESLHFWLPLIEHAVQSPHTKRAYLGALERFSDWLGPRPLDRDAVLEYRAALLAGGKGRATVRAALMSIRLLAREMEARGKFTADTLAGIVGVKAGTQAGQRAGNWLSLTETKALLDVIDCNTLHGKRDAALMALLLGCALRRAEACALTWEHLQERDGRLLIVDLIGKKQRVRSLVVPRWAEGLLNTWIVETQTLTVGKEWHPTERVLCAFSRTGAVSGPLSPSGAWWIVRRYAERLGLKFAPHDLRRTAAKLARRGGAEIEDIAEWLGHSSRETTARYLGRGLNLERPAGDLTGLD